MMESCTKLLPIMDPRRALLATLTAVNIVAFWQRNLVLNLVGVKLENCAEVCRGAPFAPSCSPCTSVADLGSAAHAACEACQTCRFEADSSFLMIQDGACFNNTQFGLLAGFGFAGLFGVCGLFAGRLADRVDRRSLLVGSCLLWSSATGAMALCSTFEGLLLTRIVAGIGQAFNAPCAYPLISQLFGPETRSSANGFYGVGTYVGAAASSLSLEFALVFGWRSASVLAALMGCIAAHVLHRFNSNEENNGLSSSTMCRISGAPLAWKDLVGDGASPQEVDGKDEENEEGDGLLSTGDKMDRSVDREIQGLDGQRLVAVPLLGASGSGTVRTSFGTSSGDPNPFTEPPHSTATNGKSTTSEDATALLHADFDSRASAAGLRATARLVASSTPVLLLFVATSFRTASTVLAASYFPVFFARAFPKQVSMLGWAHAVVILVGGGGSSFLGGRMADFWSARNVPALAWLPGLGALASAIPAVAALHCGSFSGAMLLLLLFYGFGECWLGPGMTLLQVLLVDHPNSQSTAVALLLFANLSIASIAPALIGMYDDGTARAIRLSLAIAFVTCALGSFVSFGLLAKQLPATRDPNGQNSDGNSTSHGNSSFQSSTPHGAYVSFSNMFGGRSSNSSSDMGLTERADKQLTALTVMQENNGGTRSKDEARSILHESATPLSSPSKRNGLSAATK